MPCRVASPSADGAARAPSGPTSPTHTVQPTRCPTGSSSGRGGAPRSSLAWPRSSLVQRQCAAACPQVNGRAAIRSCVSDRPLVGQHGKVVSHQTQPWFVEGRSGRRRARCLRGTAAATSGSIAHDGAPIVRRPGTRPILVKIKPVSRRTTRAGELARVRTHRRRGADLLSLLCPDGRGADRGGPSLRPGADVTITGYRRLVIQPGSERDVGRGDQRLADRIPTYGLGAIEVGMVAHLCLQCRAH